MLNNGKSHLSRVILVIIVLLMLMPAAEIAAEQEPVIIVEKVEGAVGQTVMVPVRIENPGGMAGGKVVIAYDPDIVEPRGIKHGKIIEDLYKMSNLNYTEDSLSIAWFGLEAKHEDGIIAEVPFLLKKQGEISLELTHLELADEYGGDISVSGTDGGILIGAAAPGNGETAEPGIPDGMPDDDVPGTVDDNGTDAPGNDKPAVIIIGDVRGAVGETVKVAVNIENPRGMSSGNFVLSYDPAVVEPKKVTGDLLGGLIPVSNLEHSENTISVVWIGVTGKTSDGIIMDISFLIKDEGTSPLELEELSLVDANGLDIPASFVAGSISSGGAGRFFSEIVSEISDNYTYIAVIAAVLILAAGLAVFLVKRKKGGKKDIFN